MERIKTAIIGCGRDARAMHAPTLMNHSEYEVIGTFDTDKKAAEDMAEMLREAGHHCKAYASREELLASDVQLCVVLTNSDTHLEVCTACLRAGKYTLVTKPWVININEADTLIEESEAAKKANGNQLMVFLPMSWDPVLKTIQKTVAEGAIGDVYQIRRRISTFGKRYDWQLYKKNGGGYLNNWGPHLLGQVMEFVDEPITKVCAEKKRVIMSGDCEDTFYAFMKTKSGTLINCEYEIMVDDLPHWTIEGSKGTIFVKDNKVTIHRISHPEEIDVTAYRNPYNDDIENIEVEMIPNNAYDVIYSHIASAIRKECEYRVPLSFTRQLTLLIDSIHKSADTDEIVRIEENLWNKV